MKKLLFAMASVGALAAAAPSVAQNVNAGGGMGISNRIVQLDTRLQAGIRSGEITRREARTLRMQINALSRLERQYSLNGLTQTERADLRQRIRTLRQELRTADGGSYDRHETGNDWAEYDVDGNAYGALSFDARVTQLQTRLDAGIRSGEISASEASRLRVQLNQLTALERQYSRNGLTSQEHADLQRRIGDVRQQIRTADRGRYDSYERESDWAEYDVNGNAYGALSFDTRITQLQTRLTAGIRSGDISGSEASRLRSQLNQLTTLERQYSRNGLSAQEQADLQRRVADTRQQMRVADRGAYDRYERAGDWADYDDDFDNRDVLGQGGPYEEAECESRGGIAGILQNVLGATTGATSDCGLRVGQRVSGNLSAVPYEYRNQFRDGNGIYYRTDGRSIYQIDSRTDTVLRVYAMNR